MHRPDGSIVEQASEAQVQAMNAKLARRTAQVGDRLTVGHEALALGMLGSNPAPRTTSQPPEAAQSRNEKSAVKLEWERPTEGAMAVKTKCGRYSCCKIVVMGKTSYELWKLAPGGAWFNQLHNKLDNFLQAQELARQDAEKHA